MCPPFVGAATSQSTVLNGQIQLGDVFATQTLDVVNVTGTSTMITPATGNAFSGSVVVGSDAVVTSTQSLRANVTTNATMNVTGSSGTTSISTASTGNSGEANIFDGGHLTGTTTQTVGAFNVTALGDYHADLAQADSVVSSSQAIGSSQGYGVEGSTAVVSVNQSSAALTQADGGGNLQYTAGSVVFSALGTSNNVTAVGTYGSAVTVTANQSMTGQRTQASVFTGAGNAQDITAQATTTGNNISVSNQGPYLEVNASQTNTAYTKAEANLSSFEFGSASSIAYGVGNSVMAGNIGSQVILRNTQVNSGGGIEVISGFTGDTGYDAYSTATAVGNAVTGFACAACEGRMNVTNSQTNSAEVGALGGVAIGTSARSVSGVAAATGNTATFYVTSPSTQ
ncbi:MAG: holdfast anchor protein HfaD, partial [Alphaproteobacteria bacterium]